MQSTDGQGATAEGETFLFIIPEARGHADYAYVFDSELNRLVVCATGGDVGGATASGHSDESTWIVLPGNVRAYLSPSLDARLSDVTLRFPREVGVRSRLERSGTEWISFALDGTRLFLPVALAVMKAPPLRTGVGNLPVGLEGVDRFSPLPLDYEPTDLVKVDDRWNFHASDYPKYLRLSAAGAVEHMLSEARRQGIHLRIFSAYRSSSKQRYLYLKAIDAEGLTQDRVAKPGHSEHQLGTAVDLCGLDPVTVASDAFGGTPEGRWLSGNAAAHGFRCSYTAENSHNTGYSAEPWHYRFMGPENIQRTENRRIPSGGRKRNAPGAS